MQNEIKAAAMERAGESTDFPRNSYTCNKCGDCKTRPCARADCPIPPLNSQAAMGCTCGQPSAAGVMHRSGGPCVAVALSATPADAQPVAWKLAMRVLQSDLYNQLADDERAECDALVRANPYSHPSTTTAPASDDLTEDALHSLWNFATNGYALNETKPHHVASFIREIAKRAAQAAAAPVLAVPEDVKVMEMELALYRDAYGSHAPSEAVISVLDERQRQIFGEGWSADRDDRYIDCELARAAATYAMCTEPDQIKVCGVSVWPWPIHWWKPTSYRRNLVKAGALLLAEIERIDRRAITNASEGGE